MKSKSGFTLVELIVVIALLSVLAVVASFNYTGVQRQTRDTQRSSNATLIAENLEKYFTKNGEYPSIAQMTDTDGNNVKNLLDLANTDSLLAPFATPGTTNSWKSGTATKTNSLTYNGNTDTSPSCTTGTACSDFKIQYYDEQNSTYTTIVSRHTSQAPIDTTTITGIAAPQAPAVTAALSGSNVVATATAVTCEQGTSPVYAFRSRTNNGSWGTYGSWGASRTTSTAATQGTRFGFQAKAQCDSDSSTNASTDSSTSAEALYTHPISTPATPDIYSTASFRPNYSSSVCIDAAGGSSASGTKVQIYACNGTAAQDWAWDSVDGTISPSYAMNMCVTYNGRGVQLTLTTCDGSVNDKWTVDAEGNYHSQAAAYCIDAVNFGTANGTAIQAWDCTAATAQIWNPSDSQTAWAWNTTACPAGTTVEYRVNDQTTALADSGWYSAGTTPRIVRTTVNQGYTYISQVQTRCYSPYVSSAWSGTAANGVVKAVFKPGDATGWSFGVWAGRNGWGWSWDSPACGAGTNRTYIEDSWTGLTNNAGGTWLYWLAPRTPNGVGNVGWYHAESTGGAPYVWYAAAANGRGDTYVDYPSGNLRAGVNVAARTQYRCVNPVTGRSATGDWTTSVTNYT